MCHPETVLKEYTYWWIIPNDFPYDTVAEVHHLLCPKSETPGAHTKQELHIILESIKYEYDCHLTNFSHAQSHPRHQHIHLIRWKNEV